MVAYGRNIDRSFVMGFCIVGLQCKISCGFMKEPDKTLAQIKATNAYSSIFQAGNPIIC